MQIKKYYRNGGQAHDVTSDDVIAQAEVQGYYDRGTVIPLLEKGYEVRTPYAVFRAVGVKRRCSNNGVMHDVRKH